MRRGLSFWCIVAASLASVVAIVGCRSANDAGCSACERGINPRLVVGQLSGNTAVRIVAEFDEDGVSDGGGVCVGRLDPTRYTCSASFPSGPANTSAVVRLELDGMQLGETTVELAEHNYCGREIAYVEFSLTDAGVEWSDVIYVSPCDEL